MKTELTCIRCPIGCLLTASVENGEVSITGNSCPRGEAYGKKEVTDPTRTVTGSARVEGGELPLVSVKTATDIPKDRMFDVMAEIRALRVKAPVRIGDVLLENAAGAGSDIVATRNVRRAD